MDLTYTLAKHVVRTKYEDLSLDAVESTKKIILDTLAVAVAGSKSKDIKMLVDLIKSQSCKTESTILGYGGKVLASEAAMLNSWSATVLDYDDFHDTDYINISRTFFPAVLAMAEMKGNVSGQDFITAVALGFDLTSRIARAATLRRESGFMNSPTAFGSAAAGGKLLGFGEEKIKNAIGMALNQININIGSGSMEGLNTKGMGFGFPARAGVFAVLLADLGYISENDPIARFYAICHRNMFLPDMITIDLGKVFQVVTNSFKPYPCCRFNHTSVQAAIELVTEHDIKPSEISEVMVHHGPISIGLCQPLADKRRPKNKLQAQFSLPWQIANAIIYRQLKIAQFTDEGINDKKILDMADKIFTHLTPELSHIPVTEPAIVDITLKNGKKYSRRVEFAHGGPEDPMTLDEIADKFKECCQYSAKPISKKNQDEVIKTVRKLETIKDVSCIPALLG
jgi:2-methylcitrate dehydratase PrpD